MSIFTLGTIFIIAFIGTPLIGKIALASGIIDDAGGDPLKIHKQPVALLGGLALVVAVVIGMFVPLGKASHSVVCSIS